ncbi:MAG: hypothetical protein AAGH45_00185 [Pseudomonadota bacterium]
MRQKALVFFALFIVGLTACDNPSEAQIRPICLSRGFDLQGADEPRCFTPNEVKAFLDREMTRTGSGNALPLTLTHPEKVDIRETMSTCRAYLKHAGKGWYAMSGRDMRVEGLYIRNCLLLEHITKARGARVSHIEEAENLLTRMSELPLALVEPLRFGPAAEQAMAADIKKQSFQEAITTGDVTILSTSDKTLRLEYDGVEGTYQEVARGDFDGDGNEDAYVFISAAQKGGSARWHSTVLLSRASPDGALTVQALKG